MKYRKPYRVKKKKSILRNRFFWLVFLFLLIIGGVVYLVIFSQFFQIKKIHIYGNKTLQREYIEDITQEKISQEMLAFQTKSIFLIKTGEITKIILDNFPKISQVIIKRQWPDNLILQIQEREPIFIFCKDSDLCFFLDQKGVIFEEISQTEETYFKIKDMRSKELKLGEIVIEKDLLEKIKEITSKLRENQEILAKELTLSEERISLLTDRGFLIFFNPKENISRQIQKLILTLENEVPKEKRENLEYIDLRFGSKVYYKYRQ